MSNAPQEPDKKNPLTKDWVKDKVDDYLTDQISSTSAEITKLTPPTAPEIMAEIKRVQKRLGRSVPVSPPGASIFASNYVLGSSSTFTFGGLGTQGFNNLVGGSNPPPSGDFNSKETELVAGTILGVRAWNIDEYGRLKSVAMPGIWKRGLNLASCFHEHRAGKFDCTCGFYAYTMSSSKFRASSHYSNPICGVVEASGLVTVGTKGFRAEKAEIKALVVPAAVAYHAGLEISGGPDLKWADATWMERRRHKKKCGSSVHYGSPDGGRWKNLAKACTLYRLQEDEQLDSNPGRYQLVVRNYPGVKLYTDLDAMYVDYEIEAMSTVPEPTPDDPDFWELP